MTVLFLSNACQEKINQEEEVMPQLQTQAQKQVKLSKNPLSYSNILKARESLLKKDPGYASKSSSLDGNRLYHYIRFDPKGLDGNMLNALERDTSIQILDFPFANGELYNEELALDEEKAKKLADGNLYVVVKKNTPSDRIFLSTPALRATVLDELYLPAEEDSTLQKQAVEEAGYSQEKFLRICLRQQPQGFVRYLDQETNTMVAAPNMQVWALVFGIKVFTYTDANGFYRIPWRFNIGTIMGTHAKNFRVNIKPFNTVGGVLRVIPQLTLNFIVGSVHVAGWRGTCAMRNNINIEFRNHNQGRYWAQLMHAVWLHDGYSRADGINPAPFFLTLYAHWADNEGSASAPMLGHISTPNLISGVFTMIFGTNLSINAPNLFNLLTGLLPDVTMIVENREQANYSEELIQTAFHELAHASHFTRVTSTYWIAYITNALLAVDSPCGGYGCGNELFFGHTQVGEAWAEFLGTNHARRWHPNGTKFSTMLGARVRYDRALEEEQWFRNDWIATGVFHDLMDVNNTFQPENAWDLMGGMTIRQLYLVHAPNINSMCAYRERLLVLYPFLNRAQVDLIFQQNDITNNNLCQL